MERDQNEQETRSLVSDRNAWQPIPISRSSSPPSPRPVQTMVTETSRQNIPPPPPPVRPLSQAYSSQPQAPEEEQTRRLVSEITTPETSNSSHDTSDSRLDGNIGEEEKNILNMNCGTSSDSHSNNEESVETTKSKSSVVGGAQTLNIGNKEVRRKNHNVKYDPTHRWWEPPLWAWFPETNREILYLLWIYNAAIICMARFTNFCGSPNEVDDAEFCAEDFMLHEDMDLRGFSLGLFLLLSFRANQAYDRFWEARKMWGRMREVSRDFTRLVCAHVKVYDADDKRDRRRAIHFVTAFAVACKLHLRKEHDLRRDCDSLGLPLCPQDIANIQHSENMPLFCQDVLSHYLDQQVNAGKLSDHQLSVINKSCLSVMSDALGSCERIDDTPLPLSYVLQLRFFMILWLVLFPLHGANYYGWWSILLANLVCFAVWGMESMVCEIENPFGHERNDLDLDDMVEGFYKDTQAILHRSESRFKDFIFDRRRIEEISHERHLEDVHHHEEQQQQQENHLYWTKKNPSMPGGKQV